MIRPRRIYAWRNDQLPPLPEPHPDRFTWRPLVEMALGLEPRRAPTWAELPDAELASQPSQEAFNG